MSFDSPESGIGLSDEEVSVTIKNYGADTQSFFEIQYAIDGGVPVLETVADIVNPNETLVYNFSQTADLSSLVVYSIEASVNLGGDQFNSNNTVTTEVENKICAPTMNCSLGDGIQLFSIADINNISGCEGYGDFTNLTANLVPGNTYPLTITTGYGNQNVTVWIDFNNDNDFTADEKIVANFIIAPGETGGSYTETIDVIIPASTNLGSFTMRAKTNWNNPVPEDACAPTNYGETEDYTVNIVSMLNTSDFSPLNNTKLTILDKGDKQYEAVLTTVYDGPAYIAIYNLKGQQLKFKKIVKSSIDSYVVRLDMSQVSTGMYIIRIGGKIGGSYLTEKFIIK